MERIEEERNSILISHATSEDFSPPSLSSLLWTIVQSNNASLGSNTSCRAHLALELLLVLGDIRIEDRTSRLGEHGRAFFLFLADPPHLLGASLQPPLLHPPFLPLFSRCPSAQPPSLKQPAEEPEWRAVERLHPREATRRPANDAA